MKTFFLTLISLYFVANVYVSYAVWHLLPSFFALRIAVLLVIIVGFVSPMLFFAFGERLPIATAGMLYKLGTSWMIAFLYIFIMFLLFDLFKLSNHIFHFADTDIVSSLFKQNWQTTLIGFGSISLLLVSGNMIYHNKKRVQIDIESNKVEQPLKVVAISDLHLGYSISRKELSKWVKMINREEPDVVLIAGDLIDNQVRPLRDQAMHNELLKLKAPMGVYACTGNHEFISGIKESAEFYQKSGITLLRDSVATVGSLSIIGREDYTNKNRKSFDEIVNGTDLDNFTVILDHQPNNLEDAVKHNVDLQLSGHTHYGQVFPASLITRKMFELAHGYLKKGSTHFYVSSGLGIWGGKFRIGTRSEYIVISIENKKAVKN